MLDVMRKHSRSFIIYVLFGIIIAVFVVNFGPQSAGCTSSTSYAAKVQGTVVTGKLLNYALSVTGVRSRQVEEPQMVKLRAMVLDQLIVRELMAEDAMDLGLRVPEKEIDDMIVEGRFLALGRPSPLIRNDDGEFDYDLFSRYVRYSWGLTVRKFKSEQRRELLADKFRELMRNAVKVSPQEVRADYAVRNTQVELAYVRFAPGEFRQQVSFTPAEVTAWAASHKERIKTYYEDNKTRYEKLPRQLRLQVIQIRAEVSDAAAKAAARKRAEAALKRIEGGESFAKVAAEVSDDKDSRAVGGIVGWRNQDSPGIGDAAGNAAVKLEVGKVSGVVAGDDGFTIVKLLGRRQGNVSLEQATEEIAMELLREERALELCRKSAAGYLKRLEAGERPRDLFVTDSVDLDDDAEQEDDSEGEDEDEDGSGDEAAANKQTPRFKLQETAPFPRSARHLVPGIGISRELMQAVFKLDKGQWASRPFTVEKMVYLAMVKDREDPDWKDFDKREADLAEEYATRKWIDAMKRYSRERCQQALQSKRIVVNRRALLTPGYAPPKGEPPIAVPKPCSSFEETTTPDM